VFLSTFNILPYRYFTKYYTAKLKNKKFIIMQNAI
jgi:hypothetical protein